MESLQFADYNSLKSRESTALLFNHLTDFVAEIAKNPDAEVRFADLVASIDLESHNQALNHVIKTHGWTGKHFKEGVNYDDVLQALGNLYISQQSANYTTEAHEASEAEKIISFVPSVLMNHLSTKISHSGGSSSKFVGAAMLADISGFSKFAGTMCSRGVKGLDDLHETTSGLLGDYVQIVHMHGGDVVAFAGDALICVFVDNEAWTDIPSPKPMSISPCKPTLSTKAVDPVPCTVRALHCGLELKEHLRYNLHTHIAVSYGEMKISILGGHNEEYTYLVNGPCISELASCINDAGPEQLVVTRACYEATRAACPNVPVCPGPTPSPKAASDKDKTEFPYSPTSGHLRLRTSLSFRVPSSNNMNTMIEMTVCPSGSGNILISALEEKVKSPPKTSRILHLLSTLDPEVVNAAKVFVPAPVLSAIFNDSLERISELRNVTTMFVSLDSYSPEIHHDPMTLQPFFLIVQEALHASGGYLRQFVVDDKGCAVIAMWGVPSFSYGSNCSRGVFCATSICLRVKSLNLQCSAGVTTGNVFCGLVGSSERKDYVVIGNEVNMAARLMGKAHGRVLVDNETYGCLLRNVQKNFEIGEELLLKGSSAPTKPYMFVGSTLPNIEMIMDYDDNHRMAKSTILRHHVRKTLIYQLDRACNMATKNTQMAKQASHRSLNTITTGGHNGTTSHVVPQPSSNTKFAVFTLVLGLPGTGKSTAAEFYLSNAQRRNLTCISVKCRPGEEAHPYFFIRKIFSEIVGPSNFATEIQQRVILKAMVDNMATIYLHSNDEPLDRHHTMLALETMLGLHWKFSDDFEEDSTKLAPVVGTMSRVVKSERIVLEDDDPTFYLALRSLLKAKRTVIIIEDANHCDELSWHQIHQILLGDELLISVMITYNSPPRLYKKKIVPEEYNTSFMDAVMQSFMGKSHGPGSTHNSEASSSSIAVASPGGGLLNSFRRKSSAMIEPSPIIDQGTHQNSAYLALLENEHCVVVELTCLNEQELKDLFVCELGPIECQKINIELYQSVMDVTAGNAFWCKMVAQYIKDNGVEAYSDAIGRRGGKHTSLKAIVLSRVDTLPNEQQIIAKQASIIGDEFSLELLTAVLPPKLHCQIIIALANIQHCGLMVCLDEVNNIFGFQNQLIRNTLYDLTPPSDSAQIHEKVAHFMEHQYKDNLMDYYPALSYHFRHTSGNRASALKYTVKAAVQLIHDGAYARGFVFLHYAVPLAVSRPELRFILTIVNQASAEINPHGLSELVRRMSSYNTADHAREINALRVEYSRMSEEINKTLDSLGKDTNNVIEVKTTRMTASDKISYGINEENQTLFVAREASTKVSWEDDDCTLKREKKTSSICSIS